jgi:putative membrane protein insertion efficiency factor
MKKILLFIIRLYKRFVSPILVVVIGHACRFSPTCSSYTEGVIENYGVVKGLKLSLLRIAKCHPFNKSSYFDPIPER